MLNTNLKQPSLLCEFLTEELPTHHLYEFGLSFAANLTKQLQEFLIDNEHEVIITPRRFGVIFFNVNSVTKPRDILKKGPAIATALLNEQPSKALIGFAKSCNVKINQLIKSDDGYFYFKKIVPGVNLEDILINAIFTSCKNLPIKKSMRWGSNSFNFVRPIHNLLLMYNDDVICEHQTIYGLFPQKYTYGHRFMFNEKLVINNIRNYKQQLLQIGKVVSNFIDRKNLISKKLIDCAQYLSLNLNDSGELLEEVTSLVEYPVVLIGEFDAKYLQIPKECLILTMAKNQKYFALLDSKLELTNKFLFVANIESKDPQIIIKGNQKVISARLEDAKFFFELDISYSFDYFINKLDTVVYHNRLGSQSQRVARLQQIAVSVAKLDNGQYFQLVDEVISRTALLMKADLTSEMVNEFPELQGIIGKYYALIKNERQDVARAIECHYYPRFSNDQIPTDTLSILMSLTDKIEALVGMWYVGHIPTGESDPYALRRAALGVARILLNNKIDLNILLHATSETFVNNMPSINIDKINSTIQEVRKFILERLVNYLVDIKGYPSNCVQSIFINKKDKIYLNHVEGLLDALVNFISNQNNKVLLEANKRIKNILDKNSISYPSNFVAVNESLFVQEEEKVIYNVLKTQIVQVNKTLEEHNWQELFILLSQFNEPINKYFEMVMVMTDDISIKNNRINQISNLYLIFNSACELSKLV